MNLNIIKNLRKVRGLGEEKPFFRRVSFPQKKIRRYFFNGIWFGFCLGLGIWASLGILYGICKAETIPREAQHYRSELIRSARAEWGMDAPVAVFAAQVHTESLWQKDALSPAGAQGLAQFMPSTAKWLPEAAPQTGKPQPWNPGWSLRAMCAYDKWLWKKNTGKNDFERMAFTLSAYNGGQGWVNKDKKLAASKNFDTERWFEHVEKCNAGRKAASFRENRNYPFLILKERQYLYVNAGWGKGIQ